METRTVKILIDDAQGLQSLDKLKTKAQTLENKLAKLDTGSKQWAETNAQLQKVNGQIGTLEGQLSGKLEPSTKQLRAEWQRLRAEIEKMPNNLIKASEEYKRFTAIDARLKSLRKEQELLNQTTKKADGLGSGSSFMGQVKSSIIGTFSGNAALLGVQTIGQFITGTIDKMKLLSDAQSDVMKTTGLSEQEFKKLESRLGKIDTRTSRGELLKLASEAGRLGIQGVDNIKKFVEEANIINTALGEDLGQDALVSMGRLANVFETDILNIGSLVNKIADSGTASAKFEVDFLSRTAPLYKSANMRAEALAGYSAVVEETGLQAEMSSTSLLNFIMEFVKDTEKFGKAAGFGAGELTRFKNELGTNEAFLLFLQRLQETNKGQDAFLSKLQEVGIDGSRGAAVFLTLAQNIDKVREKQSIATEAIKSGSNVTEEYNKRNSNLAGNIEKLGKNIAKAWADTSLYKGLQSLVQWAAAFAAIPLSKKLEEERIELRKTEMQLMNTNLPTAERVRLIEELKAKYPDYLGKINSETITNVELAKSIKQVNDQLINKIILQKQDEKIEEQNAEIAEKRMDLINQEDVIMEKAIKVAEKYNIALKSGLTPQQQAVDILEQAEAIQNKKSAAPRGILTNQLTQLSHELHTYQLYLDRVNSSEKIGNKMLEEKNKLVARLGMNNEIQKDVEQPKLPTVEFDKNPVMIRSIESLRDELKKLQDEYDKTEIGSKRFNELQALIANKNKEIASAQGKITLSKEDKSAEHQYEKIKKLAEEARVSLGKEDTLTEERVMLKYQRLETEGRKYFDKTHDYFVQLEQAKNDELEKVRNEAWEKEVAAMDKQFNEDLKRIEKNYDDVKKLRQNLTDAVAKNAADELAAHHTMLENIVGDEKSSIDERKAAQQELYINELAQLEQKQQTQKSALEAQMKAVELTDTQRAEMSAQLVQLDANTANQRLLIEQTYQDAVADMEAAALQRKVNAVAEFASNATSVYSSINQVFDNGVEGRLNKLTEAHETELQQLEEQKNKKVINDAAYNQQKKAIDDKYRAEEAKLKERQFQRQKVADMVQAGINTAISITKTFAQFGWPAGILPASFALAGGIAQQAVIASKPTPKFGKGKDFRGKGRSHSNGGNPVLDPISGQKIAEIEEGEVLLSKATALNNKPLVDALLNSSLNNGGASINPILDFSPFFQAQSIMATGGRIGETVTTNTYKETTNNYHIPTELTILMANVHSSVDRLNNTLQGGIAARFNPETVRDISEEQVKQSEINSQSDA